LEFAIFCTAMLIEGRVSPCAKAGAANEPINARAEFAKTPRRVIVMIISVERPIERVLKD
jgi:hypothetical protein